jgi:hypothetical protein
MDVRLAQLLETFGEARGRYALARLEFAFDHPAEPAPPLVDSCAEPAQSALRAQWTEVELQLDAALAFAQRLERSRRRKRTPDRSFRLYAQSLRELDHAARAMRGLLTVTESQYDF